ncbi:MAG: hypothetical protein ACUVUG_09790 [Candidatus Aminicenantia bacterium]
MLRNLTKPFATFDRENIHALSLELDEVIDLIEDSIFKFQLYDIKTFDYHMLALIRIISDSLVRISETLKLLRIRNDMSKIFSIYIEMNSLDNEEDKIFREAMLIFYKGKIQKKLAK